MRIHHHYNNNPKYYNHHYYNDKNYRNKKSRPRIPINTLLLRIVVLTVAAVLLLSSQQQGRITTLTIRSLLVSSSSSFFVHSFSFVSRRARRNYSSSSYTTYQVFVSHCSNKNKHKNNNNRSNDTIRKMSSTTDDDNEYKFVDIGANLLEDRLTEGVYNGKKKHDSDFDEILQRASTAGIRHLIITSGTLQESRESLKKVRELRKQGFETKHNIRFTCTIGIHPTRCLQEFVGSHAENEDGGGENEQQQQTINDEEILQELYDLIVDGKKDHSVSAIGEIGLDYDRLQFCPKDVQQTYFVKQLQTLGPLGLPLFLHNRNVQTDLYDLLEANESYWGGNGAVIHSYDDTLELATAFLTKWNNDVYIGLNGCSLKTEENLKVVKELPLNRILLETDCPYCDVKPTHAGYQLLQTVYDNDTMVNNVKKFQKGKMVKGRNEPCRIRQVAEIVAGVKKEEETTTLRHVADVIYQNSLRLYGFQE